MHWPMNRHSGWFSFLVFAVVIPLPVAAWQPTEVPGAGHPLAVLKTLNDCFPLVPPTTMDQWRQRRERLRRHVQISLGLWPLPARAPLDPVVHGRIDMGGYTIEKVYFQSFPGFFVTGNLYRPAQVTGPVPGVLCPHGHFRDGRFHQASDAEIRQQLETGAEQFASNAPVPCNPVAPIWPKWGAWFFIMTWSAMRTASKSRMAWRTAFPIRDRK